MTTQTRSATRSAFGEVLAALMGKRGITATPANTFELAAEEKDSKRAGVSFDWEPRPSTMRRMVETERKYRVAVTDRGTQSWRDRARRPETTDKAVGSVASVLGLLVVVAGVATPSRTGLVAMMGVLLGVFGYLLGARWLGSTAIAASTVAILVWLLA